MSTAAFHTTVSASFTRPSDTDAYTAKDVVSNSTSATTPIKLTSIARGADSGGTGVGYITKVRAVTDKKDFTVRLRLWLFNTATGITVQGDNAAFGPKWADRAARIGYIDLNAFAAEDSTASDCAVTQRDDLQFAFTCAAGSTDLWFICETLDAGTPASAQNFYFEFEALEQL